MPKWCWNWPHCSCGIIKARELQEIQVKILVWRNDIGDIKRVPVSELLTYAIVEKLEDDQFSAGCPNLK